MSVQSEHVTLIQIKQKFHLQPGVLGQEQCGTTHYTPQAHPEAQLVELDCPLEVRVVELDAKVEMLHLVEVLLILMQGHGDVVKPLQKSYQDNRLYNNNNITPIPRIIMLINNMQVNLLRLADPEVVDPQTTLLMDHIMVETIIIMAFPLEEIFIITAFLEVATMVVVISLEVVDLQDLQDLVDPQEVVLLVVIPMVIRGVTVLSALTVIEWTASVEL